MKQEKFKVLLYLKKSSPDKSGKTPIMGRITVGESMVQFSCKLSCTPSLWNPRESRLNGKSNEAMATNAKLDKLMLSVNEAYDTLIERNQPFNAEAVKNLFQGSIETQMTLLKLFDRHIEEVKARVGIDVSHRTLPNYLYTRKRLAEFIKKKSNSSDLAFSQLNEQFIREFQDFLVLEQKLGVETVRHYLALLKKICRIAFKEGYADRHYFANYPLLKQKDNPPRALSREDFEKIRDLEFEEHRWSHIATCDMFLFACMTGLAFADVKGLKLEHVMADNDGGLWIRKPREKTGVMCNIPLVGSAIRLIEKYKDHPLCEARGVVLPVFSNICMNDYLRDIAKLCELKKPLTCHVARHSNYSFQLIFS